MHETEIGRPARRKLLPEMEGMTARWYARLRGSEQQLRVDRAEAARLLADLPAGAQLLEVAPGPGYLAVELARSGRATVTGLDISRTMVQLATEYAARAGVAVQFRLGDVAELPFGAEAFDLVVCRAAFKNFVRPVQALDEMFRVLRPGGQAVIQDLNRDATGADIAAEVAGMGLGRLNRFATRRALGLLRRRAYSPDRFAGLAAQSRFGAGTISTQGIGLELRLTKP